MITQRRPAGSNRRTGAPEPLARRRRLTAGTIALPEHWLGLGARVTHRCLRARVGIERQPLVQCPDGSMGLPIAISSTHRSVAG